MSVVILCDSLRHVDDLFSVCCFSLGCWCRELIGSAQQVQLPRKRVKKKEKERERERDGEKKDDEKEISLGGKCEMLTSLRIWTASGKWRSSGLVAYLVVTRRCVKLKAASLRFHMAGFVADTRPRRYYTQDRKEQTLEITLNHCRISREIRRNKQDYYLITLSIYIYIYSFFLIVGGTSNSPKIMWNRN